MWEREAERELGINENNNQLFAAPRGDKIPGIGLYRLTRVIIYPLEKSKACVPGYAK